MMLTASALCLALNVYHEARGEPVHGQVAVAYVTMNRVRERKQDVCDVVYAHKQFSWTNGRYITKISRNKKTGQCTTIKVPNAKWHRRYLRVKYSRAWEQAVYVAQYVLKHSGDDITNGSTLYHATYVSPYWKTAYAPVMQIGQHLFYKKA